MKNELIHFTPNTISTNKLLSDIAQKSIAKETPLPELFTIYTDFQSAGRGMGSNKWFSDCGKNLLVSFYFEPKIAVTQQFDFNQYFAITTRDYIAKFTQEIVQIKWPNDIYVRNHKLAGDLTEHTLTGNFIRYSIAGIGINLNQEYFPEDIPHPISLFQLTGQHYDVAEFLDGYWQMLKDNKFLIYEPKTLKQRYLKNLYQLNEWHTYCIRGEVVNACIKGTDHYGRLILADNIGKEYICGFKEIVFC